MHRNNKRPFLVTSYKDSTCSNREKCCDGEGKTNITVRGENCERTFFETDCRTDIIRTRVCCGAGMLNVMPVY